MNNFNINTLPATYSVTEENSLGRVFLHSDRPNALPTAFDFDLRSAFERDKDRILYSNAFRRLDAKTQVFDNSLGPRGHYYRTRLTHSLEVAQVAGLMARIFGVNKFLSEALALGHDIGHPPFGHEGQDILQKLMANHGGFEHNLQALRLVDYIEDTKSYHGLNLMFETREGLLKHCSMDNARRLMTIDEDAFAYRNNIDKSLINFDVLKKASERHLLKQMPCLEAQITDEADAIAYTCGDLVDGFRSGLISLQQAKFETQLIDLIYEQIKKKNPNLPEDKIEDSIHSELLTFLSHDVTIQTLQNIESKNIKTLMDIKTQSDYLVEFSPKVKEQFLELKRFLRKNMYQHPEVTKSRESATTIIESLFGYHLDNFDEIMPKKYQRIAEIDGRHRAVCDFVGGMTDSYAFNKYKEYNLGSDIAVKTFFNL